MGKRSKTPTFLLELPLKLDEGQAKRLRAHLEVARLFYNAVLSEGQSRLRRMKADPAWQAACAIPRSHTAARAAAFAALRQQYGFSEYGLHEYAKTARCTFLAEHLDAVLAQTLATRAYRALNRVCLRQAKRVRFRSKARGLSSIENKRNDTGMRFVLETPEEGHHGYLMWKKDQLEAIIDWNDPTVSHGLDHHIKYARLLQRKASSPRAQGADAHGFRYYVQLVLEGVPYQKPKHTVGHDTIGLDIGPQTIAIVPQAGAARLETFCEELQPDKREIKRMLRKMDRQRRANNPDNFDEQGRIKKRGKKRLAWHDSKQYQKTRRRKAEKERKLREHRKSLHGRRVHELVAVGNTIVVEQISYKAWQKQFGRSVGLRAPGMFIEVLKRTVASTGGTLIEVPTRQTKLSQFCHGCGAYVKKKLRERFHHCPCGIGPVQRDLYAAYLASQLTSRTDIPSCDRYMGSWIGAETRLRAAHERLKQCANEGRVLPQSMGVPRARARRPESLSEPRQEPIFLLRRGRLEAWNACSEPPVL